MGNKLSLSEAQGTGAVSQVLSCLPSVTCGTWYQTTPNKSGLSTYTCAFQKARDARR